MIEAFLDKAQKIVEQHRQEYKGVYYMKGGWNPIRDAIESAASLAGNYALPGSSLVTSNLVSKGSQGQLNSTLGKIGQAATGLTGAGVGSGFTGIPAASDIGAGWTGLGNALGVTGNGSLLGTAAGAPLEGGVGPTQGSGVLGSVSKGLSSAGNSLSSALSGGTGGGGSSYGGLNLAGTALGALNSMNANDKAQKDLLAAENNSLGQLQPYLSSGTANNAKLSELLGTGGDSTASDYGSLTKPFTPGDLTQDPGYQFNLSQGNAALDRKQAATGGYFSGASLKAAQDYGQGLADNTYNNAYQRYLQQNQNTYNQLAGQTSNGLNAANSAGNIYSNIGNAQANAGISSSNIINNTLSSLLNGSGAKRTVNIGGQTVSF